MGCFSVGCPITGTCISNGDPVFMFKMKDWKPSWGVSTLYEDLTRYDKCLELAHKYPDPSIQPLHVISKSFHDQVDLYKSGIYNDYGSVEGFDNPFEADETIYIHQRVVDFILEDLKKMESPFLPHELNVIRLIAYWCFISRRELYTGLLGQQNYDGLELIAQAQVIRMSKEILREKAEEYDEQWNTCVKWEVFKTLEEIDT